MANSVHESSKPLKFQLHHFLGKQFVSNAFFWLFLSFALLSLTVAVAFIKPSPFGLFLAFFLPAASLVCVKYRTYGLLLAYSILTLFVLLNLAMPQQERLWQMSIIFIAALDLFIVLLTAEEVEEIFVKWQGKNQSAQQELEKMQVKFSEQIKNGEQLQKEFDEAIEKLKEEARQRVIDREKDEKRFALVQSEIEMLHEQKENLVNEAFEARALAFESTRLAEELKKEIESEKNEKAQLEKLLSEKNIQANNSENIAVYEQRIEVLQQEIEDLSISLQNGSKDNASLRQAFASLMQEADVLKENEDSLVREINELSEKLKMESSARACSENEIARLEKVVSEISASREVSAKWIVELQEKILWLQHLSRKNTSEKFNELSKALLQTEGLYKQLRAQFEEKSTCLYEARKELFLTKERLSVIEIENQEEAMSQQDKMQYLEKSLKEADADIQDLEGEIIALEGLISHVLLE